MDISKTLQTTLWTTGLLLSIIYPPEAATAIHEPESLNQTDGGTAHSLAVEEPQSFAVSAAAEIQPLERSSYSATSAEEIAAIEAQREAEAKAAEEEAARVAAEAAAAARGQVAGSVRLAPKMSGNFAWPVTDYYIDWDINGFRTTTRPAHDGLDLMAPAMTPIYAIHDGTVILSTESSGGYGVVVKVRSVIDGQEIITTYAHMTYGTRQVQQGERVSAGQHIGNVGMTGRASGDHLHLEVQINGAYVDPAGWLERNLGPLGS